MPAWSPSRFLDVEGALAWITKTSWHLRLKALAALLVLTRRIALGLVPLEGLGKYPCVLGQRPALKCDSTGPSSAS